MLECPERGSPRRASRERRPSAPVEEDARRYTVENPQNNHYDLTKIAFPVGSIEQSNRFFNGVLGCPETRFRSVYTQEYPLFGYTLVAVQFDGYRCRDEPRGRSVVARPRLGVKISVADFQLVVERLRAKNVPFE